MNKICVCCSLVSGLMLTSSMSSAQSVNLKPYPAQQDNASAVYGSSDEAFQPDQVVILELLARQKERKKSAASKPVVLGAAASDAEEMNKQSLSKIQGDVDKNHQKRMRPVFSKDGDAQLKAAIQPKPKVDSILDDVSKESEEHISYKRNKSDEYFHSTKRTIPITEWKKNKDRNERDIKISEDVKDRNADRRLKISRNNNENKLEIIEPRDFKQPDWSAYSAENNKERDSVKASVLDDNEGKASISLKDPVSVRKAGEKIAKANDIEGAKSTAEEALFYKAVPAMEHAAEATGKEDAIALELAKAKLVALEQEKDLIAAQARLKELENLKALAHMQKELQALKTEKNDELSPLSSEGPIEPSFAEPIKVDGDAAKTVKLSVDSVERKKIIPTQEPSMQPAVEQASSLKAAQEQYKEIISLPVKEALILSDYEDPSERERVIKSLDERVEYTPAYVHERAMKRGLQARAGEVVPSPFEKKSIQKTTYDLSQQIVDKETVVVAHDNERAELADSKKTDAVTDLEKVQNAVDQQEKQQAANDDIAIDKGSLDVSAVANAKALEDQDVEKQVANEADTLDQQLQKEEEIIQAQLQLDQQRLLESLAPPTPIIPTWQAGKGQSAYQVLSQWSRNAGVDLIWNSQFLLDLNQNIFVSGSYEQAVQALLTQYQGLSAGVQGALYVDDVSGRRTLVIETNPS